MTVAADTRRAVRANPFVRDALRAGICNYTAAARFLGVGEEEAVAAALRRYAEDLADYEPPTPAGRVRVNMQSGLGPTDDPDAALVRVADTMLAPGGGDLTGITATGDGVDPVTLAHVVARLDAEGVAVGAAGATDGVLVVAVNRRDGPDALRDVEDAVQ
ncbi:hypothetical protein N0B31_05050 [Salinirubellus salinus]|jgi:lysozyme family protein|uniref:Uncharacterized protein n=1 Tax=Salinirubellus salinus TaxID=1364945 RepID=A0A9E7UBY3_9EURY|nr:hypothetical protein [Salinirubellus salinus]UWM55652.1 hypothetical protein N0B31_05050 [Salinirubellus salinus]